MLIAGARVVLQPFRTDELDALYEARLRSTPTVGELDREAVRRRVESSGTWNEGRLDLAIQVDGKLVGEVDVRSDRQMLPPGVCEFGIELWADLRGAGIGTEAVELLTRWLHEQGFSRVQAGTHVANLQMRTVLAKVGFEHEGTMRRFMPDGDGRADYALYAHVVQA